MSLHLTYDAKYIKVVMTFLSFSHFNFTMLCEFFIIMHQSEHKFHTCEIYWNLMYNKMFTYLY